jgi:hypothetical protein
MGKRLKKAQVIEALHAQKGAVYLAAEALGVSHTTVYNWINRSPDVKEIKDWYDGQLVDVAELGLRSEVFSQSPWAIKYVLSTKGKDRGYSERTELTGVDEEPIQIIVKERVETGD